LTFLRFGEFFKTLPKLSGYVPCGRPLRSAVRTIV